MIRNVSPARAWGNAIGAMVRENATVATEPDDLTINRVPFATVPGNVIHAPVQGHAHGARDRG